MTLPTQPTFSYYATARRGRRRLKWRARSRHPCFDKHSRTESASTDCVGDVDKTESVTQLPSCFVRLRRLEATELYEEVTKSMSAAAATVALPHTNETDVHTDPLMDKECVALKVTDATEDVSNARLVLKRKLAADENEGSQSTRSPWRTKAEMKESLQKETSMDIVEEQLLPPTPSVTSVPAPFVMPTETQKTELYLTETAYSTDGDSTTTAAGGICIERRSKRIKKRRKLLEETKRRDNASDGKVMPIILKLVQEKLPEACGSCATKQSSDKTSLTPNSQCALPRPLTAARYHVVGSVSKTQNVEVPSSESQKRRRFRPKRSCCRENCSLTDDAATTEDEHAPNVNTTLPPQLISQNKGKMVIDNVNILNVNTCSESTKENCDKNKKSIAMTSSSGTSVGSSSGMTLPSQIVPLPPVLPALTPTQSDPVNTAEVSTTDKPSIAAVKLTPTKAAPAASMSLKTFSTLMSNPTKSSLFTSPVKADIIESPTKPSSSPVMEKTTTLTTPTTTSTGNTQPVSVLLRNQLIVRVPLSILSADFQKKFLKTTNLQKTPIKGTLSDTSTGTSEMSKVSALTEKLTTSSQETEKAETAESSHKKVEAREPTQAKENNTMHSNSDGQSKGSITSTELPHVSDEQSANEGQISKVNAQAAQFQPDGTKAQLMPYSGYPCGSSQYESEQSDFMGFSDGTGSSPNRRVDCLTNNSALYSTQTPASTETLTDAKLHEFISELAPEFADESEAPQANELQATLPTGEVTAALLAEAEAEAETVATQQHTQLLSETNLSEMQDVENTLSGILNEMQDQHIYTPVSSSADDFFAQSVYSPLSEPPTTPTHSMYAESPLGGVGSVGSSSMAGGGGSLSVASSPYVQHMHMEPASVSSGQMSEPSPLSAPMSVGPPTHQQQSTQQAQGAAAGYGKQYGNKYGECFTEDSTQSELIGFQNDIPCFENIELVGAAANNASASPASSQNEQSPRDLEMRALAAVSLEEATNCKVGVAKANTLQYMGTDMNACVNETNNGVQVHAPATDLPAACGTDNGSAKDYSVDSAAFAQLLNDIQETERVVEQRARAQAQEDKAQDAAVQKKQQQRRQQQHVIPQPQQQQHQHALQQQILPAEGAPSQQLIQQRQLAEQQQLPQAELLLQQQREEELLKQQQLLQQQQQQQEHLMQQKLLEQQQQEQLMQQQLLEQQRRHQQQQQQQQLLEQQRERQRQQQQQQQVLEQQRKQQQQQQQRTQIIHQTVLATPKQQHAQAHAHTQAGQQQKQHYITLPPSCAYEAAQLQLAQAANAIQPIQNLGVGVNLYAHGLGSGQEIQWASSTDLTGLSPAIIEAPAAGGGTTTYYISASDLYQPNLIATPHLAGTAQQHGHHQQQQQHRHAIELNKSSVIDANENYIEGATAAVQQRPACQQQPQQQQQIMIVIPQDYGKPGSNGATPQLYATTAGAPEPSTTYQLSQAPQAVIMQHPQPQMTGQPLPHMSTVQVNGINLNPQFIASPTVNSAQRTLHQTPPPRHMQHYQLHNATPPPHSAAAQVANRPPRCASTPSASHYQQRQQHPQQQQQIQLQAVHGTPQVRMLQHTRPRQTAMQQLQLIQPHPQPQTAKPIATIAAKPSIAGNAGTSSQKVNLVCRFCHKRPKFTSNLDYSNHIIAMHPVETPFNCPHCPMHFTRRVKRQQHIVEEHGAQRFQCAQCGQSFCTQRALDQHLQRAHALEPTQPLQTQASKQSPAQAQAGGAQQRVSRQQTQNLATAQPTATHQMQQSPQRRKCYLQQRPTWLESRHRNAAMASAAAAAAASTNSQTSMVRVEDVHLQMCDDAAKGKKPIDLQLDTTQLSAESTTTTTHKPAGGLHTPSPSSSGGKPQRILCCPDCDDPFNEDHAHAQPCAAPQQQQPQQELQAQMQQQQQQQQQQHGDFLQQLEDENAFEEEQQQQSDEQAPRAKRAHVTMPSPEQTEPDSTSTNTGTLRHFRKRRASAKLAGTPLQQPAGSVGGGSGGGGNANAAAALMADNANGSEDELLLMERVLRTSHNCLFCDARFTNDIALRKHHQLAHSNQASMPFVCSICKRGFRMRSALHRHMETHDSEGRPYECSLCHVRFPRPSQLTLHKLTVHFLRKPHACDVCGKQFGTESALKTHCKFHAVRSFEFLQTLKYD